MATETDPVIVRIIASQKDLEKSLAASVRQVERAAQKMDKSLGGVGGGKTAGNVVQFSQDAGKGMQAATQAAQGLSFQLNDIATSLSGGASPFQVMMQQGSQVAQVFQNLKAQGGSIFSALTGAVTSMLNPMSLLSFGFIALAGYALQYFTTSAEGGKEAEKTLKEQRDLIARVAKEWGDAMPALKAYNDELERQAKLKDRIAAAGAAQTGAATATQAQFDAAGLQQIEKAFALFARIPKYKDDVSEWNTEWQALQKSIKDGTVSQEQYAKFQTLTNKLLNELPLGSLDKLQAVWLQSQQAIVDQLKALQAVTAEYKNITSAATAAADAINAAVPFGGTTGPGQRLPPVTSGAGVFNPSQQQLEDAKKAREAAEQAAKDAARKAEQAAASAKREAEQAAEEAAKKLSEAIANQTKVAVDAAASLIGKSEVANAAEINSFLKRGGIDIDAATTAWCAAFVNSALAQVGIKGSGSQVATSFLGWGKGVKLSDIQRGDVLVQPRGRAAGQEGGHVGFATGQVRAVGDQITQVELLSGNSADKVTKQWVDASTVIARRTTDAFVLPAEALTNLTEEAKQAAADAKKAADEQARASEQVANQISQMAQTAIGGLVNDLRNGVSAGEAFNNMLNRIVDSLIQMSLQSLFNPKGAFGSLIGSLMGVAAPTAFAGGTVGVSRHMDGRRFSPALWAGAPKFASGGMVGLRPGEVPIIAHKGELVVPRSMVGAGGGGGKTDNSVHQDNRISIDMSGTGMVAANSKDAKQVGENIQLLIQAELVRQSRPGGLLRKVPA